MPGVNAGQIAAAKRITAMEFLRRYRADDLVPASARGEYQLKSHDSFKINGQSSVWHWKSRDIGGRSALDYLIHVEGVPFVEAVRQLCDERPGPAPALHLQVRQARPAFVLPPAAPTTARVEQYLLGRGISPQVIRLCIRQGILYESLPWHNCVFVGLDGAGQPRYAALRSTSLYGKPFKQEVAGSQKQYGFCIPPPGSSGHRELFGKARFVTDPGILGPQTDHDPAVASQEVFGNDLETTHYGETQNGRTLCTRVAVFESAIDAMAEMSICRDKVAKYRLSAGGIYAPAGTVSAEKAGRGIRAPLALTEFLEQHPQIQEIELCLDNDSAGRYAAVHLMQYYGDKYRVIDNPPAIEGGDYAELAQLLLARRMQINTPHERYPNKKADPGPARCFERNHQ